jgi:hypothetical protein
LKQMRSTGSVSAAGNDMSKYANKISGGGLSRRAERIDINGWKIDDLFWFYL